MKISIVFFQRILAFGLMIFLLGGNPVYGSLPNWLGPDERPTDPDSWYNPPGRNEPPFGTYLPPEYAPTLAVVIGWQSYTTMLTSIAQAAYQAGAEVWCAGSSAPASISGVPSEAYHRLTSCSLDTVWMRDYGPFGVILPSGTAGIIDSRYRHYQYRVYDDALPCCLAGVEGLSCYSINTAGSGTEWVILDGGNLMIDSAGILYMTERTYIWNTHLTEMEVDDALMAYFGAHEIRTVPYVGYPGTPQDGTGHIDMIAKLLSDTTVMVANADGNTTYDPTLDSVASQFSGWGLTVIRVDCTSSGGTWYTYTNSLFVNNSILIPSYSSYSSLNTAAYNAYAGALPGYTIVPINSDSSITAGGAIHCVTQLVPLVGSPQPTRTPTIAPTQTPTRTITPTRTPTVTQPPTGSPTYTPSPPPSTTTPTRTPTPTVTSTGSSPPSPTPSVTSTGSIPPSSTPTQTPVAPTVTPTATWTPTPAVTLPPTYTAFPTFTHTPPPTDTPVPLTSTPTSAPGTGTPTVVPSTETPTPSATPEESVVVYDLILNQEIYTAQDLFSFSRLIRNDREDHTADEYIVLEVSGMYWFWPDWTPDIGFRQISLTRDETYDDTILEFTWPPGVGSGSDIRFLGALIDPGSMTILGNYDIVWFDYR